MRRRKRPKELDHDAIDAVGADSAEGDFQRLADLALGGEIDELAEELARLPAGGIEGNSGRPLAAAAAADACAGARRIERGERLDAVMTSLGRSLFWKDKPRFERMLSQVDRRRSGDGCGARRQSSNAR